MNFFGILIGFLKNLFKIYWKIPKYRFCGILFEIQKKNCNIRKYSQKFLFRDVFKWFYMTLCSAFYFYGYFFFYYRNFYSVNARVVSHSLLLSFFVYLLFFGILVVMQIFMSYTYFVYFYLIFGNFYFFLFWLLSFFCTYFYLFDIFGEGWTQARYFLYFCIWHISQMLFMIWFDDFFIILFCVYSIIFLYIY